MLLAVAGCYHTPVVKVTPPPKVDVYNLPPPDDTRFDKPTEYPKNAMNQDDPLRAKEPGEGGPPGAGGSPSSPKGPGGRTNYSGGPGGY